MSESTEISNPHDGIFKKFFSDLTIAKDFLRIHIPAVFQEQMDFSTLRLAPGSYVDKTLKQYCSDILYGLKSQQGKDCYIYCLVEHQSRPVRLMPFRLLRYSLAVMQQHIGKRCNKLPLVVPLLFYQGKRSPYPYSMCFTDCFENVELAKKLYSRPFPLVDLTVIPDEEILTHKSVALLEIVHKHIRARDLLEVAKLFSQALLASQPDRELFKSLVYYISEVGEVSDQRKFLEDITQATQFYREDAMTIAQQLRQEGLQQGMQQEKYQIARNLLLCGIDRDVIKQSTGLSDEELAKVH